MARRRKDDVGGLFGVAIVGGVIWLFANHASGVILVGAIVIGIAAVVLIVRSVIQTIEGWVAIARYKRACRSLLQKADAEARRHVSVLVTKRMQLLQPDAYGNLKAERWWKELDYFLFDHLAPSLTDEERSVLSGQAPVLRVSIDQTLAAAVAAQPRLTAFSDAMTAAEFEGFCAEELRQAGWNARVTMQSRDQGVDVVADKAGVRIVLQCKLYSTPVGNKAVQEAAAGRAHEQADFACVVTNNRYTSAAEQLAATNGVLLLHFRDLREIDTRIARDSGARSDVRDTASSLDLKRWRDLVRKDPDLARIADKLGQLGERWSDQFAVRYLAVNDKSQLPVIVNTILAEARREATLPTEAQQHRSR